MNFKTLLFLVFLVFAQKTTAQQLAYQWKEGTIYRFSATQTDDISTSGSMSGTGGMDMGAMMPSAAQGAMLGAMPAMKFITKSVFALKITTKMPDGSAKGTFYLESFNVVDNKKNIIASLNKLPKSSVEADFLVDDKGNFTFTEIPFLVLREGVSFLVEAKVKKGEMAVSAEVEDEKLTLMAEFNPKTGQLKAGYTLATIAKPKAKKVEIKETDTTIDLIPTDFIDLLQLPQTTTIGEENKMEMFGTEVKEKITAFDNQQATINLNFKSAIDAQKFEKDAKKMGGGTDDNDDDKDNPTPQMGQSTIADFNYQFDNKVGMLKTIIGNITTNQNMMGMEIKHVGTVNMTLLK